MKKQKKSVSEFFDSYAHGFDAIYGTENTLLNNLINSWFRKSMKIRYLKTIEYCEPIEGKTVADIGCGPGHYSISLARLGAKRVTGFDFAKSMLEIAEDNARKCNVEEKCKWVLGDFLEMQNDKVYNYSIVMGVMEYIKDPEKLIRKVDSITTDKAFFSFPCATGLLAWQRKMRYRQRCELYMYTKNQIMDLFFSISEKRIDIERISRDYFVTLHVKRGLN